MKEDGKESLIKKLQEEAQALKEKGHKVLAEQTERIIQRIKNRQAKKKKQQEEKKDGK